MSSKLADAPFAMRPPHLHLEQARVLVANSVEVQLGLAPHLWKGYQQSMQNSSRIW